MRTIERSRHFAILFLTAAAIGVFQIQLRIVNAADTFSTAAYGLINTRASQNRSQFFVWEGIDSPFNHGFPSGLFGSTTTAMAKLHLNPSCVYSATAKGGCSSDPNAVDPVRGTVFQFTFDPLTVGDSVGLNFEEPQNDGGSPMGRGYDLTGATQLMFDAVSVSSGIQVQFSVVGVTTPYRAISQQWTTITINLNSLGLPSLQGVHLLFGIASNDANAPLGGTILLDNIRFSPVPTAQTTALGLPLANQVFGINHVQNSLPGAISIPPDQTNSNLATLYESSLLVPILISRGQPQDLVDAKLIADTLVDALTHDNQGDPIPTAVNGAGLHSGMFAGDIALFNSQGPQSGQQDQIRLSGYTATTLCPQTGFCLLLDGATGGNNAFAILALTAAYKQFQNPSYLNSALTIATWIYSNLLDQSGTGYAGYFIGYPDQGLQKILQTGKSVENNADIFAAFTALAAAESTAENSAAATMWTTRANIAGDFVMQMYDSSTGHFFAGTVPTTQDSGPGIYANGARRGNDVINTFDFLDSQTFTTLALATSPRYQNQIDWHLPIQWILNHFQRTVTAANQTFQGFDLIELNEHLPTDGPQGIAWEFTGQTVAAMRLVDARYGTSQFTNAITLYLNQIQHAQTSAPYGDRQGLVASTLQDGDTIPPYGQCLVTPFQCIAERIGLAATVWAIQADVGLDSFLSTGLPQTITFGAVPDQILGSATITLSATATSGLPVTFTSNATSICTASGTVLTLLSTGICSIAASQPGNASYGSAPSVTQSFTIRLGILNGGVVNSASFAVANGVGAPVAPGSLVTIFTSPLPVQSANFTGSSLASSLSGVGVKFGSTTVPLVAVSPSGPNPFISAQVPFEVLTAGQSAATLPVVITINGNDSPPTQASIISSAPGIFTIPPTGQGNAILVFVDPSTNAPKIAAPTNASLGYPTAPIPRGTSGFFYATGLGAMLPAVADGSGACSASSGACAAIAMPSVLIGGIAAQVTFAGQAPGFPGVSQMNITIPLNTPTGDAVSILMRSADGNFTSNFATIAVQ